MFRKKHLADALAPLGFFLAVDSTTELWFVRPNKLLGLFEIIQISASKPPHIKGARWGDAAFAGVSLALTPGEFTSPKGMSEYRTLVDHTETRTKEQASAWEQLVVSAAAAELEVLGRTRSEELLARTSEARTAVAQYLRFVDPKRPVSDLIQQLTDHASEAESREARRMARTEGLIGLPDRACYDLASLIVSRFGGRVETPSQRFWGQNPNEVPDLKWRLHLLASRLYPERGWELMLPPIASFGSQILNETHSMKANPLPSRARREGS